MSEWKDLTPEAAEKYEWSEARKVMKECGISGPETSKSAEKTDEKELADE